MHKRSFFTPNPKVYLHALELIAIAWERAKQDAKPYESHPNLAEGVLYAGSIMFPSILWELKTH